MIRALTSPAIAVLSFLVLLGPGHVRAQGEAGADTWTKFSLKQAVGHGLVNSLDIQAAKLDVRIQADEVKVQRADFDPTLVVQFFLYDTLTPVTSSFFSAEGSFVSSYGWTVSVEKKFTPGTTLGVDYSGNSTFSPDYDFVNRNPYYGTTITLRIKQPLLKGGWIRYNTSNIKIAEYQQRGAAYAVRLQGLRVALGITTSYWELVRANQNLTAAQQSLIRAEKFLENIRQRVEAEKLPRSVLPDAQANLEDKLDAVFAARLDILNAEDRLKRSMHLSDRGVLSWARIEPTDKPEVPELDVDPMRTEDIALENRPELQAALLDKKIAELNLERSDNEKLPQLDLTAFVQWQGMGGGTGLAHTKLFDGEYRSEGVSLTFSMPIGNRQARARYEQAALNVRRTRLTLRQLEQQIVGETRTTYRTVPRLKKQVEALKTIRLARAKSLEQVENRFDVGRATSLDVVTAQDDLATSERDLISARVAYNISLTQLYAAMGTLLDHLGFEGTSGRVKNKPVVIDKTKEPEAK